MNQEIEEIIIGLALAHPKAVPMFGVSSEQFSDSNLRAIWNAILALISEGLEPDPMSVWDRIPGSDIQHIATMALNARAIANLKFYLAEFAKYSRAMKTRSVAHEILDAMEEGSDADKIRAQAIQQLTQVGEVAADVVKDQGKVMMEVADYIESVHTAKFEKRSIGVPTGITWLDKATGGMHKSNLIVVGARPAMGKTALAMTIANNAAMRGYKVLFVSTEMSSTEIGLRHVSLVSGVPSTNLRDADLSENDFADITRAIGIIKDLPLTIVDLPNCKVSDVLAYTRAQMLTSGVDLLIVDYLGRLQPDGRSENRTREIGQAASAMKSIARVNNIPVLLLSQVNRGSVTGSEKRPSMAHLRDSGEIEQEADQVWMLHRPCEYDRSLPPEDAEIIIEKNRHGPTALINCAYRSETMRWTNRDPIAVEEDEWDSRTY